MVAPAHEKRCALRRVETAEDTVARVVAGNASRQAQKLSQELLLITGIVVNILKRLAVSWQAAQH
jgi:hypothetical protein